MLQSGFVLLSLDLIHDSFLLIEYFFLLFCIFFLGLARLRVQRHCFLASEAANGVLLTAVNMARFGGGLDSREAFLAVFTNNVRLFCIILALLSLAVLSQQYVLL